MEWLYTGLSALVGVVIGGAISIKGQLIVLERRTAVDRSERLRTLLGELRAIFLDINPDAIALNYNSESWDQQRDIKARWAQLRPPLLGVALLDSDPAIRAAMHTISTQTTRVIQSNGWVIGHLQDNRPYHDALHDSTNAWIEVDKAIQTVSGVLRGEAESL